MSPSEQQTVLDRTPTELYIGGAWRPATGGATLPVEDPSTGQTLVEVADATPEDALEALGRRLQRLRHRGRLLLRASGGRFCAVPTSFCSSARTSLALLMTLEMGKAVGESRAELTYAAEFLRWFSEEAVRIHGRYMTNTTGVGRILTMRQPVGPCVFVTPWNFPTAMGTRKIAPAIAAGLHDGRQARATDASLDARAGRPAGGRGSARWRAQRHHRPSLGRGRSSRS